MCSVSWLTQFAKWGYQLPLRLDWLGLLLVVHDLLPHLRGVPVVPELDELDAGPALLGAAQLILDARAALGGVLDVRGVSPSVGLGLLALWAVLCPPVATKRRVEIRLAQLKSPRCSSCSRKRLVWLRLPFSERYYSGTSSLLRRLPTNSHGSKPWGTPPLRQRLAVHGPEELDLIVREDQVRVRHLAVPEEDTLLGPGVQRSSSCPVGSFRR